MVPDFGLPYRPYLLLACIPGFVQLAITFFLRDVVVDEATYSLTEFRLRPSPPAEVQEMHVNFRQGRRSNRVQIFGEISTSKNLWRFLVTSTIICGGE